MNAMVRNTVACFKLNKRHQSLLYNQDLFICSLTTKTQGMLAASGCFFGHRPKRFWNDWRKFSHFGQNVQKYKLINTVMATFRTTVRQMTKIWCKQHLLLCSPLNENFSIEIVIRIIQTKAAGYYKLEW